MKQFDLLQEHYKLLKQHAKEGDTNARDAFIRDDEEALKRWYDINVRAVKEPV